MKHKPQPTQTTQPSLPFETGRRNAGSLPASVSDHSGAANASTAKDTQAGSLRSDAEYTAETTLAQLRAENERLKRQLQERDAHSSLKDKLARAGARTPKLLLEAAKNALRFTAAGQLANAAEIIDGLKDKFPEQFGGHTPQPTFPSIDAGTRPPSKPTLTREALAKMKPAEIAELDWNDVRRVLSAR